MFHLKWSMVRISYVMCIVSIPSHHVALVQMWSLRQGSNPRPVATMDSNEMWVVHVTPLCMRQKIAALLRPGIEPGSSACEALVLTDIRTKRCVKQKSDTIRTSAHGTRRDESTVQWVYVTFSVFTTDNGRSCPVWGAPESIGEDNKSVVFVAMCRAR